MYHKLVKAVLQDASLLLKGNTKCGKYDIIMTSFVTGFFFHEILGHVLEDDFIVFILICCQKLNFLKILLTLITHWDSKIHWGFQLTMMMVI